MRINTHRYVILQGCVSPGFPGTGVGIPDKNEYIQECDNILIASPIYFSELTGRLLDVGSRLQTYFCARFFRKEEPILKPKKGAVILVGGGDGHMEKAYGTACTLLHHMNCRQIHEPPTNDPQSRTKARFRAWTAFWIFSTCAVKICSPLKSAPCISDINILPDQNAAIMPDMDATAQK